MGHRDGMSPERCDAVRGAAAPFPAAPPSKWRLFNNSVIFWPIFFKFGKKVDHRMGNDGATSPQRCGSVRGSLAPFLLAPPSKWRPFKNCVIFQPISFYVVQKLISGLLAGGSPILQQLHCVLAGLKKFTIEHAKRTYELTFTGTAELLQLL